MCQYAWCMYVGCGHWKMPLLKFCPAARNRQELPEHCLPAQVSNSSIIRPVLLRSSSAPSDISAGRALSASSPVTYRSPLSVALQDRILETIHSKSTTMGLFSGLIGDLSFCNAARPPSAAIGERASSNSTPNALAPTTSDKSFIAATPNYIDNSSNDRFGGNDVYHNNEHTRDLQDSASSHAQPASSPLDPAVISSNTTSFDPLSTRISDFEVDQAIWTGIENDLLQLQSQVATLKIKSERESTAHQSMAVSSQVPAMTRKLAMHKQGAGPAAPSISLLSSHTHAPAMSKRKMKYKEKRLGGHPAISEKSGMLLQQTQRVEGDGDRDPTANNQDTTSKSPSSSTSVLQVKSYVSGASPKSVSTRIPPSSTVSPKSPPHFAQPTEAYIRRADETLRKDSGTSARSLWSTPSPPKDSKTFMTRGGPRRNAIPTSWVSNSKPSGTGKDVELSSSNFVRLDEKVRPIAADRSSCAVGELTDAPNPAPNTQEVSISVSTKPSRFVKTGASDLSSYPSDQCSSQRAEIFGDDPQTTNLKAGMSTRTNERLSTVPGSPLSQGTIGSMETRIITELPEAHIQMIMRALDLDESGDEIEPSASLSPRTLDCAPRKRPHHQESSTRNTNALPATALVTKTALTSRNASTYTLDLNSNPAGSKANGVHSAQQSSVFPGAIERFQRVANTKIVRRNSHSDIMNPIRHQLGVCRLLGSRRSSRSDASQRRSAQTSCSIVSNCASSSIYRSRSLISTHRLSPVFHPLRATAQEFTPGRFRSNEKSANRFDITRLPRTPIDEQRAPEIEYCGPSGPHHLDGTSTYGWMQTGSAFADYMDSPCMTNQGASWPQWCSPPSMLGPEPGNVRSAHHLSQCMQEQFLPQCVDSVPSGHDSLPLGPKIQPNFDIATNTFQWVLQHSDGSQVPIKTGRAAPPDPFVPYAAPSSSPVFSPTSSGTNCSFSSPPLPRASTSPPGWSINPAGPHQNYVWQGGDGREIRFIGSGPEAERSDTSSPMKRSQPRFPRDFRTPHARSSPQRHEFQWRGRAGASPLRFNGTDDDHGTSAARALPSPPPSPPLAPRSMLQWRKWAETMQSEKIPCGNLEISQAYECFPAVHGNTESKRLFGYCAECAWTTQGGDLEH